VVRTWLEIRELEAQLALTERTIANFEDNLVVVRNRYLRGLVSALDLRLARQNLAAALAKRPFDQRNVNATRRRLEILLGRYPAGTITSSAPGYDPAALPDPLPPVPAGLPSTLLERRPDLIAAEMQLAAATARIGQAKAALFPRIALTADGGTRASDIADLFMSTASVWSLVANLTMPLINRGELTAQVKAAQARTAQAVSKYRGTVLHAFGEVEGALDAEYYLRAQEVELRLSVDEARRSLVLAEERYRRGLDNLLLTLDSQRRLFNSESNLLQTQRASRTARVNLILALGGPWDLAAAPSPLAPETTTAEEINDE
jgi:NodT family efflux transporter outer membrane factor (OMF) lipoprotein